MQPLSVTDAIRTRSSVRAFTDHPVAEDDIREILAIAARAPSNGNVQPWKIYVRTGDALRQALDAINDGLYTDGKMDTPEFPPYPEKLAEPYRTRRYDCGERMYGALGIPREDKIARIGQVMKNYRFFGAPVGMILTMDERMSYGQAMDLGIFLDNVMLLAKERGLDSCPQVSWAQWPDRVRAAFDIPAEEKIMVGASLGYAADEPVNHLDQPRTTVDEFATFSGFEAG